MSEAFVKGSQGDFFVQDDWTEPFAHLTCVSLGDLPLSRGDLTPVYCPDPSNKGQFKISDQIRGAPTTNTTTLTRPLSYVANWLLEQVCAFNALVTYACRGSRAIPQNYQVAVQLFDVELTNSTIVSAAVAQQPDEEQRIPTNADLAYADRVLIYHLDLAVQDVDNLADANDVTFLPMACASECGPARGLCQYGFMAMDGTFYDSEVKYTKTGGATWAEATTDPFSEGGDAGAAITFDTYDGHRLIVARTSTIGYLPAEVSWSEDYGATWHDVSVGSMNGQTINALSKYGGKVWAACSGGDIYMSKDIGSSWTRVETGSTLEDLNAIVMYSETVGYSVGNGNTFLYTTGGDQWNTRTGPAPATNLLSVAVNDIGYIFVGATDGVLYMSTDQGTTWVAWKTDLGAGSVDWVGFDPDNRYTGVLIHNSGANVGTVWRSIDGGVTWEQPQSAIQATAWNSGLNSAFICDPNNVFVVGNTHDGNTFVAKFSPASG